MFKGTAITYTFRFTKISWTNICLRIFHNQKSAIKYIRKNASFWIIYACFTLALISCKKENALDCFKSNGATVTEKRNMPPFNVIKLYNKIDIYINQGPDYTIEVRTGKNIIKNIKTTVSDGVLTIDNSNKCNFVRGYKEKISINITLPYLTRSENRGVGTIRFSNTFTQDTLQVMAENSGDTYVYGTFNEIRTSSHNNGDIYLNGTCKRLFGYVFGTNVLNADSLKITNYVFVESISIGDCFINAPNGGILEYNIWRSGNIYYTGNPAQITNYSDGTGKGRLIKKK